MDAFREIRKALTSLDFTLIQNVKTKEHSIIDKRAKNNYNDYHSAIFNNCRTFYKEIPALKKETINDIYKELKEIELKHIKAGDLFDNYTPKRYNPFSTEKNKETYPNFNGKTFVLDLMELFCFPEISKYRVTNEIKSISNNVEVLDLFFNNLIINQEQIFYLLEKVNPFLKNTDNKAYSITNFKTVLSDEQLKYLYNELARNQFINDLKTDEIDFINVFTKKFNKHDSIINFSMETTQIAYIFHTLKNYFTDFYKCIEASKKFYSKNGTQIKSNNISSQLSKTVLKQIPVKNSDLINNIISNIPKQ